MESLLSWIRTDRGFDWPRVVLVGLVAAVSIALVVSAATATTDFSPYNPSWEGSSEFRNLIDEQTGTERVVVREPGQYEGLNATKAVVFVIGPNTAEHSQALASFVERGGTLVLLDNFGAGNAVLESVGASARFDGRLLKDERHNVNGPAMPLATEVSSHPVTAGVEQLSLNYGTTVAPGDGTVLVRSSPYGYLVESESDALEDGSELAARPVAVIESVGDGEVITVGDPSITINVMLTEPDNRQFLSQTMDSADTVVLDQTHGESVPPLVRATLFLRETPPAVGGLGVLLVGGIVLLNRRRSPTETPNNRARVQPSDEAMAAYLKREHPEWDDEHVAQMITAFNRSRPKNRNQ